MDLLSYIVLLTALGVTVLLFTSLLASAYAEEQVFENWQKHDTAEVSMDQELSAGID